MYVYFETERSSEHVLYTVGFYTPDGTWKSESDHNDKEEAASRVAFLNGSSTKRIDDLENEISELEARVNNIMINAGVSDF